ncbi:uncharacterized protein BROUX77_001458 [Berkeleyomyces rouxiae]|uniref:uncharacterized protein n=1 Tax=Berkeleyomyces rouxiae TaxID=2035830 RepID=UPI003B7D0686
MQPGPRSVVVGDFNLHHSAWDPRCATDDNDAELLLAWMEERALLLGNADGEPTHESGSVIDLTIMSSPLFVTGASVELREDLTCGSDHFPLLVSIPLPGHTVVPSPAGRFLMDKLDKKKFDAACKAGAARLDDLVREYRRSDGQIPKKKHIDDFARLLQDVILDALVASTPKSLGKAKSFPWWNKECSVARAEQSAARNRVEKATTQAAAQEARTERREAKKRLRRALRSAARAFYADLLAKVTDTRDLFRIVKWRTKAPHRHSPALSPADGAEATVQDTTEKIALLRSVHMPSARPGDIESPALQVEPRTRGSRTEAPPTRARITRDEVEAALWRPRNTAPGPDGLSNNVLKLAWPSLKRQVTHLFNASFFWGHHPASFKKAKVITLPKPNKKDRSSPRAYRLISLLPTLAKCLERIVARRLSCWALEAGHIQDNYAGAVPGRSAEDMCLRLAHSLERTADLRGESSVLTFDIKGAFDAVHPNRMVKRLADLGCPAGTCRWVSSFLAGRRASLTLDGVSDALQPTGGSLPQGSPISPILFMLFMSPLFKMPLPCTLRGYADDGCLVNSDSSLEGNCSVLSRSLELVDSWCTDNGMALDLTKSELLHVTRKRHGQNPSLRLSDGSTLEAVSPRETLRWLGVRWSRNLSFVPHIRDVAQRTAPAIRGIQILSGCWKGAPIKGALTAVRACVVAKLSYAAATWWRPTPPNAPLSRGLLGASRLLDRTVRRGLRAALPLYCTTPCAIYNLASGFPPMRYALDNLLGSAALRVALAPPNHPLGSIRPMWGILGELRSMLPYELSTSSPPPCKGKLPSTRAPIRGDKEAAAAAHLVLVRSSPPSDLWLYTDGSKLSPNRVGAGWVIIQGGQVLLSGNRPVPFRAEVHDAEVLAIAEAITAVDLRDKPRCRKVWICSDNMAAVSRLTSRDVKPGTSEEHLRRAQTICADWLRPDANHPRPRPWPDGVIEVEAIWVPGHSDVVGNELADRQAGWGADIIATRTGMSLSWARSEFRARVTTAFRAWWEAEGRNTRFHLRRPVQAPKKAWTSLLDETDRNLARAVLKALSGHGDFAAYHRRFEHEDAVLSCPLCGADTSPEHIWVCHHNPQRVSSSFFQKLIGTKHGACWLAAKAAKAPTALLAHRRMRPDTQAQDAAPPALPLPPGDGVPSGSPP